MTTIYADNAATTKLSKTALEAMMPYLTDNYGNPSSLHTVGQNAAEALFKARKTVADCIGADPKEIIFTGGGSEADNQALLTAAESAHVRERSILFPMLSSITQFFTP